MKKLILCLSMFILAHAIGQPSKTNIYFEASYDASVVRSDNVYQHVIALHNNTPQPLQIQLECEQHITVFTLSVSDAYTVVQYNYGSNQSKKVKITALNINAPPITIVIRDIIMR